MSEDKKIPLCELNATELPSSSFCSLAGNRVTEVYFDPQSKKVYDVDENLIGTGVMDNGILTITPIDNEKKI